LSHSNKYQYIAYHSRGIYDEPYMIVQNMFGRIRILRFTSGYQNYIREILLLKMGGKDLIYIDEVDGRIRKIERLK